MEDYKTFSLRVLKKVRELNDNDLRRIVEIFNMCQVCWQKDIEKCEYRKVRKLIGLGECQVAQINKDIGSKGLIKLKLTNKELDVLHNVLKKADKKY